MLFQGKDCATVPWSVTNCLQIHDWCLRGLLLVTLTAAGVWQTQGTCTSRHLHLTPYRQLSKTAGWCTPSLKQAHSASHSGADEINLFSSGSK